MSRDYAQTCFVDMPFGKKVDPTTGVEIDFDQIYEDGIKPAVEAAGLQCIRGDKEDSGGIIHQAMFARLLLCDFVIADLTTANANVFYELGVRHTARPYTTIPTFAPLSALPFDIAMIRAIPYDLKWDKKKRVKKATLTKKAAAELQAAILARIEAARRDPVEFDSPLFQLFTKLPKLELSHEITDLFQKQVQVSEEFQDKLDLALAEPTKQARVKKVRSIHGALADSDGTLHAIHGDILLLLLLTYRDLSEWLAIIELYDQMPAAVAESVVIRQQLALALNRQAEGTRNLRDAAALRKRAIRVLQKILKERGASAETYGILGRIHKSQYLEALKAKKAEAKAHLDEAIDAYTEGFECEPVDFYPGVNAVSLLAQRGTAAAEQELARLMPLVTFAVARRGGANSADYWDRATVLELAVIGRDDSATKATLPGVLAAASAGWMAGTTADNLDMILSVRKRKKGEKTATLRDCVKALRQKQRELDA